MLDTPCQPPRLLRPLVLQRVEVQPVHHLLGGGGHGLRLTHRDRRRGRTLSLHGAECLRTEVRFRSSLMLVVTCRGSVGRTLLNSSRIFGASFLTSILGFFLSFWGRKLSRIFLAISEIKMTLGRWSGLMLTERRILPSRE